jgi:ribosomal protein S18 acetylase RimI-like enzyme
MDPDGGPLFAEFDETTRRSTTGDLPGELTVRPARAHDTDALGRISAEREGGEADEHAAAFRRALEDDEAGHGLKVLVAELNGDVIGFGKTRYLDEERGAGAGATPEGWYLTGVVVDPRFRRRGVGSRLTAERLRWISERSGVAYYFSNARNRVSIALHERFGFTEVARGPEFAGVSFVGGEGVLFRVDLSRFEPEAP